MVQILDKPIEQPWAYATKPGWKPGEPAGNYFRYFETRALAEKSIAWMERKGRWHGPIKRRPGESRLVGYV